MGQTWLEELRFFRRPGLYHCGRSRVIVPGLEVAARHLQRMKGLLGRDGLPPGGGMLIAPCSSIHMFFMRFAIDAVFFGASGEVRKVYRNLAPWRIGFCAGAAGVIELAAGEAERLGLQTGDQLCVVEQEATHG